jgi:uncharacterized membrane protein YgdD (TMEM256/DUF423 family)
MKNLYIAIFTSGFLAVLMGAFGAHALNNILSTDKKLIYETANKYHFYHTLASFLSIILFQKWEDKRILYSIRLFLIGNIFFSGSLYTLSITGIKFLGAITPIGGILYLLAWFYLIHFAWKKMI